MKPHRTLRFLALLLTAAPVIALLASGCSATKSSSAKVARPVHWGYEGHEGPRHWGALDPAYAACGKGTAQSPIDISKTGPGTGKPWKLDYKSTSLRIAHHEHVVDIVDNGHTIQVTVDEGSTLTTARNTYQLKQFHFHTPSEHTVNGKHFPMEVHFVHQSADGNFAVVGALFEEGPANEHLAQIISHFPKAKGDAAHFPDKQIDLQLHLPASQAAYYYIGSFTTPPRTENVEWIVLRDPIKANHPQLEAFAARLHHNNRPVQSLHDRKVSAGNVAGGFER